MSMLVPLADVREQILISLVIQKPACIIGRFVSMNEVDANSNMEQRIMIKFLTSQNVKSSES